MMKKVTLLLTVLILNFSSFASSPVTNESIDFPKIWALTPYDSSQITELKDYGVRSIIIESEYSWETQTFNELGLITTSIEKRKKGIVKKELSSIIYEYDKKGRLILRKWEMIHENLFDSISYDAKGRIVRYISSITNKTKNQKVLNEFTYFDLVYLKEIQNGYILIDKNTSLKYFVNRDNKFYKCKSENQIDSLSIVSKNKHSVKMELWSGRSMKKTDSLISSINLELYGDSTNIEKALGQSNFGYDNVKFYFNEHGQILDVKYPDQMIQTNYIYSYEMKTIPERIIISEFHNIPVYNYIFIR